MRRLDRLWRALGRAPVLSGVRAAWDDLLGEDARVLRTFLRALPEPASTYPCPQPGPDGCPRGVVVHGADDIVAVCRARPKACETLTLSQADIVAYELDTRRLGERLRALLGLAGDGGAFPGSLPGRTSYVGVYQPVAGHSYPVYLALSGDGVAVLDVVESLIGREPRPFVVLVPAAELLAAEAVRALGSRGSVALGLADVTVADDRDHLVLADAAAAVLAPFRKGVLREAAAKTGDGMVFFPTPAGATWEQVRIRFRDGHTVSVSVLGEEGVFHYAQMGMASRKNAEPTVQWKLLKAFAESRGTMTWRSSHADAKNKKRRENLAKDLRAFFRIDGDPIPATPDGKGWHVRFELHDG